MCVSYHDKLAVFLQVWHQHIDHRLLGRVGATHPTIVVEHAADLQQPLKTIMIKIFNVTAIRNSQYNLMNHKMKHSARKCLYFLSASL